MKRLASLLVFLLPFSGLIAQELPNTQVYLFEIEQVTDSQFVFRNPKYLTGFNPYGYNNQPCFINNQKLYLSVRFPQSKQTDIYALDLEKNTKLQVTHTAESEYSPTLMPDGYHFSAVRVELDEVNSQRLWKFPISRLNNGEPLLPFVPNVGYHFWLDAQNVALFLVDQPNYLAIANITNGSIRQMTPNIGRCFQRSPSGRLVYVHKVTESEWWIKALDPRTLESQNIVQTLPGSEDFAILPDGTILMGNGPRLYKYHPRKDSGWVLIGDFRAYKISSITRLAVSKDNKLAFVARPGQSSGW
ncbi:MAG: hypothetical protein D6765_13850 [Bacteroidetes bacterium]|nr:MAG: hypothetical protein D6765_13850 [Bacteroidota bacterium]